MRGYSRLCLAFVLAFILLFPVSAATAAETLQQRAFWGIMVADAGGQGVKVTAVRDKSPAGECLQTDDILLAINGVAVRSVQDFNNLKNSFPLYTPLNLTVKRKGAVMECQILLEGRVPLTVKALPSGFTIPGVPPPPIAAPSAIEALDQINVLDQVILDPKSGRIAVIGHYDSRFRTGAIPYLDLLKTAMAYPQPKFDLNTANETDAKTMVMRDWDAKDFILGHPDLEQERQLYIHAWASACGLAPEELASLYNYVYFGPREVLPPGNIRVIQSKLLASLGYGDAAQAYDLVNQSEPGSALKALQLLGQSAEGKAILAASGGDTARAQGKLTAAVYLGIMEKIYAPVGIANLLREDLAQGRINWQEAVKEAQGQLMPYRHANDKRDIAQAVFNKIQFTEKGSQAMIKVPLKADVLLSPKDIEPNSQLNRILYEADYSLKSTKAVPHLFWHIPGAVSEQEYEIAKGFIKTIKNKKEVSTDFWFEPKSVAMAISPDRRVVNFGAAQMNYRSKTYFKNPADAVGQGDITGSYDDWCAGVINSFDDYAAVLPAFHKVREAAKVIALANWFIAEKMPVNLSGIVQEKWNMPAKVTGFWRINYVYYDETGTGSYERYRTNGASYSGGVTFKRSNWTEMKEDTNVTATDQLSLSAGLGQKAVVEAQAGNLEQARYLAELSAQAMNGSVNKASLTKLNITVPEARPVAVDPANIQLQKEMLKQTYRQITTLANNPAAKGSVNTTLAQLDNLYDQVKNNPVAASDYLIKLQTGQLPPPTAPQPLSQPVAKPQSGSVCGESSLGAETLPADRKAYLTQKLAEARDRLKYINEALGKLIAINAAQRAENDKLVAQVTEDYEAAKERAYDFAVTILLDLPLAKYADIHDAKVKQIDDKIKGLIARSMTPMSADEHEALSREIQLVQSLKANYVDSYTSTGRLLDVYGGTGYGRDLYKWDQDTRNSDFRKRALEGAKLAGKILLDHPELNDYLKTKEWFGGNKLWQVVAMGKLAAYASDFFWDIMNLYVAWGPLATSLQSDLQANTQAMEQMRLKAAKTSQEIDCLEKLLR